MYSIEQFAYRDACKMDAPVEYARVELLKFEAPPFPPLSIKIQIN